MSNIFVGEYSTIREVLRQIFIYGCYDRTVGASDLNISARKYDNELKRLRCFWSDKAHSKAKAKNCLNHFLFDGYKDDENYLWRSYCTKAFSPQVLNLDIFSCQFSKKKVLRPFTKFMMKSWIRVFRIKMLT